MEHTQKYYRAIQADGPCECGVLLPQWTDVEKTKKVNGDVVSYWAPLVNEPPVFWRSTEKVLCFSKTPGGAIIGAVTGEIGFRKGIFCVCETTDNTDVDISDATVGDFSILEEVRFHKPVETKVTGTFVVNDKLLDKIGKAYGTEPFLNINALLKIRDAINKQVLSV